MKDKNYEHPLFSLNLVADKEAVSCFYLIQVPGGLVSVDPALLRRARSATTSACEAAVYTCLAAFDNARDRFCRHGLSNQWATGMRYWTGRLMRQEELRQDNVESSRALSARQQSLIVRGRDLWHAVTVATRLASMRSALTGGTAAPREAPGLAKALSSLIERISVPATTAALADNGFGAELRDELCAVAAALNATTGERTRIQDEYRVISGHLQVIRGALLGDLSRFAQIATVALPRAEAAALQVQRLLPPWRRGTRPIDMATARR